MIIACSKDSDLLPEVVELKKMMQGAKDGEHGLGLTTYNFWSLVRTTRLEVVGGPDVNPRNDDVTEYVFSSETKPIVINRLGNFPESGAAVVTST